MTLTATKFFDVITTPDGDIITDANGMTVSDAELSISDDDVIWQPLKPAISTRQNGEDFLNDIINV